MKFDTAGPKWKAQREAHFLRLLCLQAAFNTVHNLADTISLDTIAFFQIIGSARN